MTPSDDDSPALHWPPSELLDAEFPALRQQIELWITLLQACSREADAIEQRLAGLQFAYNNAADYAVARLIVPLSRRELQVLRVVTRGLSNQATGQELGISQGTVKNHMTAILSKLHVRSRTDAVRRARVLGIL